MMNSIWAVAITICVVVACGTMAFSCKNLNERYYTGMQDCIAHGGSWVPNSQSSYSATCVNGRP